MIASFSEALHYLYENLPMFQKVGAAAYRKDLTNTRRLCDALGNPHQKFKSIHIAGTNGKGSTSHMLASILQEAGYNVGLYTSPHLKSFTERIRINGREVDEEFVVSFVNRMRPLIEEIHPSFFEITVAMAFEAFAHANVDVAVIEVGMGGRLDSTNIITPVVSVITNISWDHQQFLGNTLQEIAGEKAGIIKPSVPVIVGERQAEVQEVFQFSAASMGAEVTFASDIFRASFNDAGKLSIYRDGELIFDDVDIPLKGIYQERNVPAVLAVCDVMQSHFTFDRDCVRRGLERVVVNTGLKGRWQKLGEAPAIYCDTAHNAEGVRELIRTLNRERYRRLFMVIGMVNDKDIGGVLSLLPREASYYFCQASVPRALDAKELQREAVRFGLHGKVVTDVNEAVKEAIGEASKDDLVFIGGSTFVVAELEQL